MANLTALLLQADDLGTKQQPHTPGSEGPFSRAAIFLFMALLGVAAVLAIRMIMRGAAGTAASKKEHTK